MSEPTVSDKKFCERLRRQADDGHHWDRAPAMLRESAERIERLRAALEKIVESTDYSMGSTIRNIAREALRGAELRNRETPTVVGTGPCHHPFKVHYTRGDGETGITCATCAASLQEPKP